MSRVRGYRKQLRRERENLPPFRWQPRDVELLDRIRENRFLDLTMCQRLFPPMTGGTGQGTNYLGKRLTRLFHHGYLDRVRLLEPSPIDDLGHRFVYAITRKGVVELNARRPDTDEPWPLPNDDANFDLSANYIDHALMIARFRVALEVALRAHPWTLATFEREHQDLRERWTSGGATHRVNPDAFFVLEGPASARAFFLEADRATMQLDRMLEKFESYAALYQERRHQEAYGVPSFQVLTIATTAARARNLVKAVANIRDRDLTPRGRMLRNCTVPFQLRQLFLFGTEESYRERPENILAAILRGASYPAEAASLTPTPTSFVR